MGTRIIKQDDGKFGLFSTISDRISAYDCTEEEMIEIWKERAAERAEKEMKDWLEEVKKGDFRDNSISLRKALTSHQFHSPGFAERHPEYADEVEWDKQLSERKKELSLQPNEDDDDDE